MQIGARTTGGVVKITVTTGGAGYAAPPVVTIAGTGGASAVAHMAGTRVESVFVANPGAGYTASPSVSIAPASTSATISSFTASTSSGTVTLASALGATTWARVVAGTNAISVASFHSATEFTVGTTSFPGTGAVTLHAAGTGAAATAFAYTGPLRPITFFKGRYQDLYGIDGMGRGFRWNGDDASVEKIGLCKPAVGPALTAATASTDGYVAAIQMVRGGAGYSGIPTVTITGGTPDTPATARAVVTNGRVSAVVVTNRGSGYKSTPTISFSGGIGTGASFGIGVVGRVDAVRVVASGSGYTTTPSCTASTSGYVFTCNNHGLQAGSTLYFTSLTGGTGLTTNVTYYAVTVGANTFTAATTTGGSTNIFSGDLASGTVVIPEPVVVFGNTNGLTSALATVGIGAGGRIDTATLASGGTGATSTGVTASVVGGGGTGALLQVDMRYAVASVTAVSSGSGYYAAPVVTMRAASNDPTGDGAAVTSFVNTTGNITGLSVVSGGEYSQPPTALILDTSAAAQATVRQSLSGKYKCAIRYIDDTPESQSGPIPSSISELVEIDTATSASSLTWSLTHYGLDDRVHAVELWRSTADQSVILFRVATIKRSDPEFSSTYVDVLSDPELQDSSRDGYALMPVTLPNGQINARRFQVPPAEFCVATMFQDRAWYAVDATGEKANTLHFSEIDEPESVPVENEFVLQENTTEPDKIVALVPLGSQLLVAQQTHLYALSYVSQPIIDASIMLVAYRGILNSRCWCVLGGAAIIADSVGIYAFDGQGEDALSVAIDDYWRDGKVDMSKSELFHMRADPETKTVRFFYCQSSDSSTTRALCYCVATKAWWEETYPAAITATCSSVIGGAIESIRCLAGGQIARSGGLTDFGTPVPYELRTGNSMLSDEGPRTVGLVYKPTNADSPLQLRLHYNNSPSPRPNAIASDRGDGFATTLGSTAAVLNMSKDRSALGSANGFAQAHFSGRVDDRSAGGDRHIAVAVGGTQSADGVVLYAIQMKGAQ